MRTTSLREQWRQAEGAVMSVLLRFSGEGEVDFSCRGASLLQSRLRREQWPHIGYTWSHFFFLRRTNCECNLSITHIDSLTSVGKLRSRVSGAYIHLSSSLVPSVSSRGGDDTRTVLRELIIDRSQWKVERNGMTRVGKTWRYRRRLCWRDWIWRKIELTFTRIRTLCTAPTAGWGKR